MNAHDLVTLRMMKMNLIVQFSSWDEMTERPSWPDCHSAVCGKDYLKTKHGTEGKEINVPKLIKSVSSVLAQKTKLDG